MPYNYDVLLETSSYWDLEDDMFFILFILLLFNLSYLVELDT
jgi:hypothetical protein